MTNGKGNMILITIIAIATLLVAAAGTTFAYFGAIMPNGESSQTIEVTSGTLSTEYNGDAKIVNGFVNQGDVVGTKDFTITGIVTGSNNLNYEATMVVNNNTYQEGELVYTVTSINESNNGSVIATTTEPVVIPTGTNTILLGNGVFAGPTSTGLIHKYTITITRVTQADEGQEKAFDAKLFVNQAIK